VVAELKSAGWPVRMLSVICPCLVIIPGVITAFSLWPGLESQGIYHPGAPESLHASALSVEKNAHIAQILQFSLVNYHLWTNSELMRC